MTRKGKGAERAERAEKTNSNECRNFREWPTKDVTRVSRSVTYNINSSGNMSTHYVTFLQTFAIG